MMLKKRLPLAIACGATLITLAACATNSRVTRDFCLIYEPVYTAPQDTEETKLQVDRNNAAWKEICPRK